MDSLLWACDVAVVVFLCRWALREAKRTDASETAAKHQRQGRE